MKRVLILCTGNSCRSQMAQALWADLGQGIWDAESAGSNPAGYVHPLAIEVMQELGHDLSQNQSKHLKDVGNDFDLVVTVCDNAQQSCPVYPGKTEVLHWPFEDPAHAQGTEDQKLAEFRRIRDQIRTTIAEYLGVRSEK